MAVSGAKPKPDGQRRTRHPLTQDWTIVADRPYEGGPALPERVGGWPAATTRWWAAVSRMPHCELWTEADWAFALDTAEVHARFALGETQGTELRIREKLLGVTLDARRDLRIRYVAAPAAEAAPAEAASAGASADVLNLDDFRDL